MHGLISADIAKNRIEINQARLLVMQCAASIDRFGNKKARDQIAIIKAAVPSMACNVIDRCIQAHGIYRIYVLF